LAPVSAVLEDCHKAVSSNFTEMGTLLLGDFSSFIPYKHCTTRMLKRKH